MATEVLLELLHYNGAEDCLTTDQVKMMIRAERHLQDRINQYLSECQEFPLEDFEKVISESICMQSIYLFIYFPLNINGRV